MDNPIAFKATGDLDTLHYYQAMRALDKQHFIDTMTKEVEDYASRKHWELIPIQQVLKGTKVLCSV